MPESKQLAELRSITADHFFAKTPTQRQILLNNLSLSEVKGLNDRVLLNKYLVMQILFIADRANSKSHFNLTHRFLSNFGAGIQVERPEESNAFKIWHMEFVREATSLEPTNSLDANCSDSSVLSSQSSI